MASSEDLYLKVNLEITQSRIRRNVYSLPDGELVVEFPHPVPIAERADVLAFLDIIKRQISGAIRGAGPDLTDHTGGRHEIEIGAPRCKLLSEDRSMVCVFRAGHVGDCAFRHDE